MRKPLAIGAVLVLTVAACGSGSSAADITDVWARSSPMMADAAAVYMNLEANEDDALVGVSVDASVAARAEVHETVEVDHEMDEGEMGEGGMDHSEMEDGDTGEMEGMGAMTMQEVDSIELPAGETVALEPGGFHVMLLELAAPLETGETFDVTLTFDSGAEETISVEVRDQAP